MESVTVQYLEDYAYAQLLIADGHAFVADEPPDRGGDGLGPDPYELLLWALGTCTAMTLLMYGRRKGYKLTGVAVQVEHDRVHAEDAEADADDGGAPGEKVEVIRRKITVKGELGEEERARLLEIATRCPVHRTLQASPKVIDTLSAGP